MLELVSLVGVDEHTNIKNLIDQHDEFMKLSVSTFSRPVIEYGFLYSETRASSTTDNRYPSYKFIMDTKRQLDDELIPSSIHLCGSEAVDAYLNGEKYILELIGESRVQLNFNMAKYSIEELIPKIITASKRHQNSLILQKNKSKNEFIQELFNQTLYKPVFPKIDILHDASGGYGKEIDAVEPPYWAYFTGYAGGLKPGNIIAILEKIEAVNSENLSYYIDMESGIRTNDVFDLQKCKDVFLEVLESYKKNEKS